MLSTDHQRRLLARVAAQRLDVAAQRLDVAAQRLDVAAGDPGAADELWTLARRLDDPTLAFEAALAMSDLPRLIAVLSALWERAEDGLDAALRRLGIGLDGQRARLDALLSQANEARRVNLGRPHHLLRALVDARLRDCGLAFYVPPGPRRGGSSRSTVIMAVRLETSLVVGVRTGSGGDLKPTRAWPGKLTQMPFYDHWLVGQGDYVEARAEAAMWAAQPADDRVVLGRTELDRTFRALLGTEQSRSETADVPTRDPHFVPRRFSTHARAALANLGGTSFLEPEFHWAVGMRELESACSEVDEPEALVGEAEALLAHWPDRERCTPDAMGEYVRLLKEAPWTRLYRAIRLEHSQESRDHTPFLTDVLGSPKLRQITAFSAEDSPTKQIAAELKVLLEPNLSQLKELSLRSTHYPARFWQKLSDAAFVPTLIRLRLDGCVPRRDPKAKAALLRFLSRCVALEDLELNGMHGFGIEDLLPTWSKLHTLRLAGSPSKPTATLLQAAASTPLRHVALGRGAAAAEVFDALHRLLANPIESLELDEVRAPASLFEAFLARLDCPSLTRLALSPASGLGAGTGYAVALARAALPSLRDLALSYLSIGPDGAQALASAAGLGTLTSLVLEEADIGDAGLSALAAAGQLDRCRHLDLTRNGIQAAGIRALVARELPELTRLDLTLNRINTAGFEALAAWPSLAGVETLCLGHTQPGNKAISALRASPFLQARIEGVAELEHYSWRQY